MIGIAFFVIIAICAIVGLLVILCEALSDSE